MTSSTNSGAFHTSLEFNQKLWIPLLVNIKSSLTLKTLFLKSKQKKPLFTTQKKI